MSGTWFQRVTSRNYKAFKRGTRSAARRNRFRPLGLFLEALEDRRLMAWVDEGPHPTTGAQVVIPPNNDVVGGIHAIAPQPGSSTNVYIGAVNGGIWKTTDAGVNWTPLTDSLRSQSIGAVTFDPNDATNNTLVAGTGRWSNFARRGDDEIGLYRTTNGGTSWSVLNDGNLTDKKVSAVLARGATLLAGTNTDGLWRSTNTGAVFSHISDGAAGHLPNNASVEIGRASCRERVYSSV